MSLEKPVKVFFVTVIQSNEGSEGTSAIKQSRCWGFYEKFEEAERCVLENHTDIYEMGYYDYAVIEEMSEGVMAVADSEWWYKATYVKLPPVPGRSMNYEHIVERIDKPQMFAHICNFCW